MLSPISAMYIYLENGGTIPSCRVSRAKPIGYAKGFPYWDVVPYVIKLNNQGKVSNYPARSARSVYRSFVKAFKAAEELEKKGKRVFIQTLGILSFSDIVHVSEFFAFSGGFVVPSYLTFRKKDLHKFD